MLDNAIHAFLLERKTAKLKSLGNKVPDRQVEESIALKLHQLKLNMQI